MHYSHIEVWKLREKDIIKGHLEADEIKKGKWAIVAVDNPREYILFGRKKIVLIWDTFKTKEEAVKEAIKMGKLGDFFRPCIFEPGKPIEETQIEARDPKNIIIEE